MSKTKEPPELDIPEDDEDVKPKKSIFEKPASLKRASQKKSQSAKDGESEKAKGPDEGDGQQSADGQPSDSDARVAGGKPGAEEGQPPGGKPPAGGGDEGEEGEEEEEGNEAVGRPPTSAGATSESEGATTDQPQVDTSATSGEEGPDGEGDKAPGKVQGSQEVKEAKKPGSDVEEVRDSIIEDAVSGKVKADKKSGDKGDKSDMSVPQQMLEEALPDGETEEEMSPKEVAGSIVTEMVTGKKPKGKSKGRKDDDKSFLADLLFGDSPQAVAGEVVSEIVPTPQKIAKKVVTDIISPEYHAKKIIERIMPGRDETPEGIAEKMVSLMLGDDDMDEDVTQYIWEGPCSSSSSSTAKSGTGLDKFDRENYIERYKAMYRERFIIGRKNLFLQKKVYEHYKRKMLLTYFETIEDDQKAEVKYLKDLKEFEEFVDAERTRRAKINMELVDLEKKKEENDIRLRESLNFLIDKERENGLGLINEKTGKMLLDKTVERLLKRQRETVKELVVILQKYIRIRDFLASKEQALVELETIGVDCYLKDYQQLQMENQSYSDKIEERDEELMRLRQDATSSMQVLAHVREKANATTNSICALHESLETIELEASQIREHIQSLKIVREKLREKTNQMKVEAGLLVQHRLVKDFEKSIEDSLRLRAEIEQLKSTYIIRKHTLAAMHNSLGEQRKGSVQSNGKLAEDSRIFREMISEKLRDMLDEREMEGRGSTVPLYDALFGEEEDRGEEEEEDEYMPRKRSKQKSIRRGRPNFFPSKKLAKIGSYIK